MKNVKRFGCFLLSMLVVIVPFMVNVMSVKAAEKHTNFYLFSLSVTIAETTTQEILIERVNGATHTTDDILYDIPDDAQIVGSGWVDITESGNTSALSTSAWGIRTYYNMAKEVHDNITSSPGNYTPSNNPTYHYYNHGGWSKDGNDYTSSDKVGFIDNNVDELIAATIIPEIGSKSTFDIDRSSKTISVTINRQISNSTPNIEAWKTPIQYENLEGVLADWVVLPALYYVSYTVPDAETPLFSITQFYYDNNTGEEIQASKVMGTNYENGKTYSIACPATVGSYRLVSNANTSVTINNADGESKCYYELTSTPVDDEIQENPTTSDIPIYIVWAIGAGALGYSVYYFNKYYRKNKEM